MRKKNISKKIKIITASFLGKSYIDFVFNTSKIYFINFNKIFEMWKSKEINTINIFWHNRIAMMPRLYKGKGAKILISEHTDGEIITKIVEKYKGLSTVRGSTKKGAIKGLKSLLKEVKNNDICITPDGPRGPKYFLQPGTIYIAKLTNNPIIPLAYSAKRKYIFNSWDNFIFPYPFNEIVYIGGNPIWIDNKKNLEKVRRVVQQELRNITEKADKFWKS